MNEDISVLRVSLYDCDERPSNIISRIKPTNSIEAGWIPQTIADQIWVMYRFKKVKDRIKWEKGLPTEVSKWLDRGLIEHALRYGFGARDENGFKR